MLKKLTTQNETSEYFGYDEESELEEGYGFGFGFEEEEYNSQMEQREITILEMCRKCYSFRSENGWHFGRPARLFETGEENRISVQFSQCPACVEEVLAMYDTECA